MRKIFTLCILGAAALVSKKSSAQLNESFENGLAPLTANCWEFTLINYATSPSGFVINGSGSLYSEPLQDANFPGNIRSPYLIVGSSIDVSFLYKMSNNLTGQATRTIMVDLVDSNANVVKLATINVAPNATTATTFSQTFSVAQPGLYRLSITMTGNGGGGNNRMSIDDVHASSAVFGCLALAPLPVQLTNFQGNKNLDKVTLQWTTATNEMNDRFEIERSNDGATFTSVGLVMADEKPGTESYQFVENVTTASVIYYRLKMYDRAQTANYSKVLIFKPTATKKSPIRILNNPTTDKLNFSYYSDANHVVDVKVYDMNGKMQMSSKLNIYQGSNVINIPLSNRFLTGMYVLEVNDGSAIQTAKFIRQ